MRLLLKKSSILLSVLFLVAGCASSQKVVLPPLIPETPEEILKAKEIWQKIEERQKTVKNTTEWITNAYSGIKIKTLATVPIERYHDYKKFLDNGSVYIINHPAFYTFFHHAKIERKNNSMSKNILDLLLDGEESSPGKKNKPRHNDNFIKIMKEFELIGRNFLEFKSIEKKLVILILPGNYKKYSNYRYKNGHDEYARFINDVTNMSESVLYLESKKPDRGQITDEDMGTLVEFLQKIGATSILLGGEYIGRCQEDFFKQISEAVGTSIPIEIIPELSPVSPDDMNNNMKDLLDSNDRLSVQAAAYNILANTYAKLDTIPKLRHLKYRLFYENPNSKQN